MTGLALIATGIERQGLIKDFVCDQIEAPSPSFGGDSELWAPLP